MDCLHIMAPTDEELLSFALDDETLPEEKMAHLEHCEICRQRLARYREANTYLVSRFYRRLCPSGTELSYYCAGGFPEEKRISIANHILDCPLCAAEVEETRRYLQEQPIEFPARSRAVRALVRRIFATRVSRPQPQFVLRGEAPDTTWPRQYKADSVDLSLHLSRTSTGEHMLLGILTSTDSDEDVEALAGAPAELYSAPWPIGANGDKPTQAPLLRTRVDDLGNIVFKPVPSGEYVMVIYLPGRELVIEGLVIE